MASTDPQTDHIQQVTPVVELSLPTAVKRGLVLSVLRLLGFVAVLLLLFGDAIGWLIRRLYRSRLTSTQPSREQASIVILNYEGRPLLEECLPSVLEAVRQDGHNHEIVVVDNGSCDDSLQLLKESYPQVRVVPLDRNYHFAAGNNMAVRLVQNDIVILLNNDILVDSGFLRPLLDAFHNERVFAAASQIFFQDRERRREETGKTGGEWQQGSLELFHGEVTAADVRHKTVPVLWASGGACAVDRRKFQALGGFDSLFFPFYFEDTDLSWQAWRRGWTVLMVPASVVTHKHRATIATRHSLEYIESTIRRNQILFVWKNIDKISWLLSHAWCLPSRIHQAITNDGFKFEVHAVVRALLRFPAVWKSRLLNRLGASWTGKEVLERTSRVRRSVGTNSINFSQTGFEAQLGDGWFPVESSTETVYRWTAGECWVVLYPHFEEQFLQLRGNIPSETLSRRPEVGVEIYQDGELIYSQWYYRPQSLSLKIRVALCPNQPHIFRVKISSTFCPAQMGIGDDVRQLGVTISEMSLL